VDIRVNTLGNLLDKIDQITQAFTFNGYAALVSSLLPAIVLAITAYIALMGWLMLQSWSALTINQLSKHVLKIAIVFTFATQWDVFSKFIYQVLTNGPNEISAVLMRVAGNSSDGVNAALEQAFNSGMSIGEQLWNLSGISTKLAALVIWLLNYFVVGIALLELAAAKFGLSITLVLAPLFFLFVLWQATQGIFANWLRFAFGFALTPTFISAVLLVINQLMQLSADQVQAAIRSPSADLMSITPFVLSGIASIGLLFKAAHIAVGIAGGVSVSALGTAAVMAGAIDRYSGFASLRRKLAQQMSRSKSK
jgi:type IV secretion system protein VirB6